MTRYRLSATAECDVAELLEYVARHDGWDRAMALHDELTRTFALLGVAPRAGRVLGTFTGAKVRCWSLAPFVIFYEGERAPVVILRVLHGRRDLDRILQDG